MWIGQNRHELMMMTDDVWLLDDAVRLHRSIGRTAEASDRR